MLVNRPRLDDDLIDRLDTEVVCLTKGVGTKLPTARALYSSQQTFSFVTLPRLATDIATVINRVDAATEGQYGAGIGSEDEERQLDLLIEALREHDDRYRDVTREVGYPNSQERYDLQLPSGTPVEAKLLRYWRANGDPEHYMPKQVLSPFHGNTLLTDAMSLHEAFDQSAGLLGLFYKRADDDPTDVEALPERFTAADWAEKIKQDIEYWYEIPVTVEAVASFDGLQHAVQSQGAAITWSVS